MVIWSLLFLSLFSQAGFEMKGSTVDLECQTALLTAMQSMKENSLQFTFDQLNGQSGRITWTDKDTTTIVSKGKVVTLKNGQSCGNMVAQTFPDSIASLVAQFLKHGPDDYSVSETKPLEAAIRFCKENSPSSDKFTEPFIKNHLITLDPIPPNVKPVEQKSNAPGTGVREI